MGYRIFGQVINRVAKYAEFGHKEGKGFGKWAAHPQSTFLEVLPLGQLPGAEGKSPTPRAPIIRFGKIFYFNIDNEKAIH